MLLKHKLFDGGAGSEGWEWAIERFKKLDLPVARIELRGFSAGYLSEYNDVDIALDTFPYVGGLTTVEALLMGVPVATLYGDRHGMRFGLSFLSNVGLADLAASARGIYVKLVCFLAEDKDLLIFLHRNLRSMVQKSPLMDSRGYARNVELLYKVL